MCGVFDTTGFKKVLREGNLTLILVLFCFVFCFSISQQITRPWLKCPHPVFGNLVRLLPDAVVASAVEASAMLACLVDNNEILLFPVDFLVVGFGFFETEGFSV